MNSRDDRKVEIKAIHHQVVEAKKNKRADALVKVKRACKELGFITGVLKGSLGYGKKAKIGS